LDAPSSALAMSAKDASVSRPSCALRSFSALTPPTPPRLIRLCTTHKRPQIVGGWPDEDFSTRCGAVIKTASCAGESSRYGIRLTSGRTLNPEGEIDEICLWPFLTLHIISDSTCFVQRGIAASPHVCGHSTISVRACTTGVDQKLIRPPKSLET
jgi:hypothetical protein